MLKKMFQGCLAILVVVVLLIGGVIAVAIGGAARDWDWTWRDPLADVAWATSYEGTYTLTVEPETALVSDVVAIRAEGFEPNQLVGVQAEAEDVRGVTWASAAVFQADASGAINLTEDAPVSGSYGEVDPMGLFWSMRPTTEQEINFFGTGGDDYEVRLSLVADGQTLANATAVRLSKSPDLIREEVATETVRGVFYRPNSSTPLPTILIIGGSEGGLQAQTAALWASHGYAALAVGYFGLDGLPNMLSEIPLETFDNALAWLRTQPSVDVEQIAIHGTSRGSEAALLTAIANPDLAAVITVVPSSMVWSGLDFSAASENRGQVPSAWTRDGVQLAANNNSFSIETFRSMIGQPARLVGTFEAGLNSPAPESIIPVEEIEAPILLISGTDDQLWPSSAFADQIMTRLAENDFTYESEHLKIEGSGHVVFIAWQPPATMFSTDVGSMALGGSREANGGATGDVWQTQVSFLERHLGR